MDHELLSRALTAEKNGQMFAFATIIESTLKGTPRKAGAKMVVLEDGTSFGSIGGGRNEKDAQQQCLDAIKSKKPKLVTYDYFGQKGQSVCGGQIKVFIEPFTQQNKLILCGAGHIGLPFSMICKILDFHVTVIDNRKEFANKKKLIHVDQVFSGNYKDKLKQCKIDQNTYIMIVTQGNEFDYECLEIAINSKAGYIGVISSKAKRIKFFKRLKDAGVTQKSLKRINIPAGIDIGAQSPAEIAVSIAAEIVRISNQNQLDTDKFKEKIKGILSPS
ncbi:MAG: XdhC family protein [Candidatus Omnitrophota bacterium]